MPNPQRSRQHRELQPSTRVLRSRLALGQMTTSQVGPCYSTGTYVLSRAALEVGQPDAAVLQSPLYRSIAYLFRYNSGLVREYLQRGRSRQHEVREQCPKALGMR